MEYTEHITIDKLRHMKESEDHVEFKSARHNYPYNGGKHTDPRDRRHCVLGYIVALANERGGLMVLGMQDRMPHDVCGSDFAQGEVGQLEDAIYETLRIRVKAEELYEDGKRVLVIKVPSRPIGRLLKYEGVALMRVGESLREMSDAEMLSILTEQEPDYSAKVCEGLTMEDLDKDAIDKLVAMYSDKQKNPTFAKMPVRQILIDLELMQANGKLTYAALILLGKREAIRHYLPQDEIIIEYRLYENSIPYTARQEYQEPLMLAIDKVWAYVNQPASNPLQHINDGPYIWDIPAFNEDAIREGVLNACIHRSMLIKSSVVIKQSPKSISIINAGGFPKGVDQYNLLTTASVPRAKLLCEVLQKTGLIERSGQGVDKVYYNCLVEGKALPDYSSSDAYQVCLRLYAEIEDPAFHLFVKNEQKKRDEGNKLSVFHLLALYDVKRGMAERVNDEILEQLMKDNLVVDEDGKLRLCDFYREMQMRSRGGNPTIKDPIKDIDPPIKEAYPPIKDPIKDIDPPINDKINDKIKNKIAERLNITHVKIIIILENDRLQNRTGLSKILGLSSDYLKDVISFLASSKIALIKHVGSNKTGGYQLTEKGQEVYRIIKDVIDNDR